LGYSVRAFSTEEASNRRTYMPNTLENAVEILEKLVSFESLSGRPTHGIVGFIQEYLTRHGIEVTLSYDKTRERANVFATIGPQVDGGVVLNGHTDVVPIEGQQWSSDPFRLTRKGDRLYGRGSVDMKGFLACVLASVPTFKAAKLNRPIHIAFSYDEEIGGYGMPVLIDSMATNSFRPEVVIIGEPTQMQIVTGHKGGYEMRTEITGFATHSCDPTKGVNAINAAMKGTIEGGAARNATAGWCHFNWEYRQMPGEDGARTIAEIEAYANNELLPAMKAVSSCADIKIITEVAVPALDDRNATQAAAFVSAVTGLNSRSVVSFGTDGGYFSDADYSTVIFGPGNIDRAHKADEYIEMDELAQGLDFLSKVAARLSL